MPGVARWCDRCDVQNGRPDLFEPENGVGPLCPPADSGSRTVHFKRLSQVHNGPLRQHTLVHKPVPRRSRDRQQRWRRWQHHVFKRKRADRNVHHATCSTRHVCHRNRAACRRQGTLSSRQHGLLCRCCTLHQPWCARSTCQHQECGMADRRRLEGSSHHGTLRPHTRARQYPFKKGIPVP